MPPPPPPFYPPPAHAICCPRPSHFLCLCQRLGRLQAVEFIARLGTPRQPAVALHEQYSSCSVFYDPPLSSVSWRCVCIMTRSACRDLMASSVALRSRFFRWTSARSWSRSARSVSSAGSCAAASSPPTGGAGNAEGSACVATRTASSWLRHRSRASSTCADGAAAAVADPAAAAVANSTPSTASTRPCTCTYKDTTAKTRVMQSAVELRWGADDPAHRRATSLRGGASHVPVATNVAGR